MHIQEKKIIYIPRKQKPLDRKDIYQDDNIRCFPVDNIHSTYGWFIMLFTRLNKILRNTMVITNLILFVMVKALVLYF